MAVAQCDNLRIVGRPLHAAIPAVIRVGPVAIVLAVRLIVLVIVADQIQQRKTVMDGDEIDARPGSAAAVAENVGRARNPRGEIGDQPLVSLPKPPHRIPVLPVPFGPAGREIPELISIGAEIPWLGHELQTGHDRVLPDRVEKRAALPVIAVLACQGRAQIEAKAVDMHLLHPIAE